MQESGVILVITENILMLTSPQRYMARGWLSPIHLCHMQHVFWYHKSKGNANK